MRSSGYGTSPDPRRHPARIVIVISRLPARLGAAKELARVRLRDRVILVAGRLAAGIGGRCDPARRGVVGGAGGETQRIDRRCLAPQPVVIMPGGSGNGVKKLKGNKLKPRQ